MGEQKHIRWEGRQPDDAAKWARLIVEEFGERVRARIARVSEQPGLWRVLEAYIEPYHVGAGAETPMTVGSLTANVAGFLRKNGKPVE